MTRLQHLRAAFAVAERHPHAFGPHLTGPVVIDLLTLAEASVAYATATCHDMGCEHDLDLHTTDCPKDATRHAWLAAVERFK